MKKIMFGAIGFVSLFALLLQSVPAHAETASALTPQEAVILKQSLDILGTIVNSIQAQAGTASPENREKILAALVLVKSSLVQINGTLAGLEPQSQAVAKKTETPQPAALKQAPVAAAPAPQMSAQPSAGTAESQTSPEPFVAGLQPNESENNLASTDAALDPRNIWWPSLVIAALGLALFLYVQKRNAIKTTEIPETHQAVPH